MDDIGLTSIWLPILLVAVATFIASAIFWTAMPWHEKEFRTLPNEAALREGVPVSRAHLQLNRNCR